MNRYMIYTAAALLTVALTACSGGDKEQKEEQEELPIVKIENVSERDVDQVGTYTATAEADLINNISSAMPARIKQILVDEGMRVSKGQRLVVLDDVNTTSYELQVQTAKASLKTVEADYNRAVELLKIGGGTQQAVDQMQAQLVNARNAVAAAERTLRHAVENTVLTSPINGVVTARNYDPGDMTGGLPILTIAQPNPIKIAINVSESEFVNVKKGMPANVTFDTYGDEVFSGKVTMISPTIDQNSRTFGVEITVPNPGDRILPGMFGRVSMVFGTAVRVVVPDKAVIKQPGSGDHYVYVYKDGKVSYNKVELGQRIDNSYELISGVDNGAQVVISGQSKLANGAKVQLAK